MGTRGPKPLPRRRLRRHRVVVFLNDAELARVKRAAGRAARLGSFVRRVLLRAVRTKQ